MQEREVIQWIKKSSRRYPCKEGMTEEAKRLAEEKYGGAGKRKAAKRRRTLRALGAAAISAAVVLAVALPVGLCLSPAPPSYVHYVDGALSNRAMPDVETFLADHAPGMKHFSGEEAGMVGSPISLEYYEIETDAFVYLNQTAAFLVDGEATIVELDACASNVRIEAFEDFFNCKDSTSVDGITVQYSIFSNLETLGIRAYFEDDAYLYFLDMSQTDSLQILHHVVGQLTHSTAS